MVKQTKTPPTRVAIVKKRTKKFVRHHGLRYDRLGRSSWRFPHGIDSCARRQFKGSIRLPGAGYGSNKKTRFMHRDGLFHFRVVNVADLEALIVNNKKFAIQLASCVSAMKRKEIIKRADIIGVKVVNRDARLKAEEDE
uniref:60S ribosomal protein L32-2 n=1 Tax=Stygiella incarcerata TaxID=1712417 RepID=A0A192ZI44_9EUKA|nr:60S ribosomal protein L32-2 [Stygiella incarcerata]|eukprot:TRINITY_DN297_c0_g1_i1.p1 TRINITY_DN297_c0_g1~~TRINITY_DN297_c0_g1_i1.p1  ORF type:complete len:139 (+),score=34.74 TRINITY_DN297_c0_g1_i1:288-704(+)